MDQFVRTITQFCLALALAGVSLIATPAMGGASAMAGVVDKAPDMNGAPTTRPPAPPAPPAPVVSHLTGQCHTVTVCAPPPPVRVRCRQVHVRHLRVHHREVVKTIVLVQQAPAPEPIVIVLPPPCPPLPPTPVDYPSAVQNGYLVWPSR